MYYICNIYICIYTYTERERERERERDRGPLLRGQLGKMRMQPELFETRIRCKSVLQRTGANIIYANRYYIVALPFKC